MADLAERLYRMVRLRAGDYLMIDNERRNLWRITSYEEDGTSSWRDEEGRDHPSIANRVIEQWEGDRG